jgi:hypothetical protein
MEDEKFSVTCELVAVGLSELTGKERISKFAYTKIINALDHQNVLPLESIIHSNLYRHGIAPISVERFLYSNSHHLNIEEKSIVIANGSKPKIIERFTKLFDEATMMNIFNSLRIVSLNTGRFKRLLVLKVGDFARKLDSIPNQQVYLFILKYFENPLNWILNEDLVRSSVSTIHTVGTSLGISIFGFSNEQTTIEPSHLATINSLWNKARFLIKEKESNFYRFRVYKINVAFKTQADIWSKLDGNFVLLIGHLEKIMNKFFFCDVNQLKNEMDYIEIEDFPGLDKLSANWEYILIGTVRRGKRGPTVTPWAFIKKRPLIRSQSQV